MSSKQRGSMKPDVMKARKARVDKGQSRGVVLRKLLVGLTGFAVPKHVPHLT